MAEETQIQSKLDLEGSKQERIKITVDSNISSPSNFVKKQPIKGDHIRVKRKKGLYFHHGIYISDNEVIHLTGDSIFRWDIPKPECTSLDKFLDGGKVEVREYTEKQEYLRQNVDTIVENARKLYKKGPKGYHLLWNNCECFANSCVFFKDLEESVKNINMGKQAKNGIIASITTVLVIGGTLFKVFGSKKNKGQTLI